jgi:putative ABC transport system substrate-binding protein
MGKRKPNLRAQGGQIFLERFASANTMLGWREFPEAGGLISYGPNLPDVYRRSAALVDKILKGTRPADLPVETPTQFELVVNLKAAKMIGLTISESFLLLADKVIE